MNIRFVNRKLSIFFGFEPGILDMYSKDSFLRRVRWFVATAVFAVSMIAMHSAHARANLIFSSDFESGSFSGWGFHANKGPSFGTVSIVSSPKRAGNRAACFDLRRDAKAPKRRRSEIHLFRKRQQYGKDYWYGWSVYLPSNWVFDNKVSSVMVNWHLNNGAIPERSKTLAVPLTFNAIGSTLRIRMSAPSGKKILYSNSYTDLKGRWTDFVVHAKWSTGGDGIIEVWKNGKQIVNFRGANSIKDPSGAPYFKLGIYKPEWSPTTRAAVAGDTNHVQICYDEVFVGGPSASFKDVAAHGAAKTGGTSAQVEKTTAAANRKPLAKKKSNARKKKKSNARKKKINIKTCNKHKGKKRANCRKRVKKHNRSVKK